MDWLKMPPLSALRAFDAFATAENMSAAGALLNVSHAAISQQIKALETHVGLALVDRASRVPVLTEEGQRLAQALDLGFGAISRVLDELTGTDAARALHVTTTPSFAAFWLMTRLAGFRRVHPEIDLMLNATAQRVELTPGGVDMAIRFGVGNWPGMESELLFSSPLVVVAAPSLVGDAKITAPEQLAKYPWIQELGTSEGTDWLRRHGVESGRAAGLIELPGNLMLDAARDGQGVNVTVAAFVQADIAAGRLRALFDVGGGNGYHIVTRPGVQRPQTKHFIRWLRSVVREGEGAVAPPVASHTGK